LVEHWVFGGNNGVIEANRISLWTVKRWHRSKWWVLFSTRPHWQVESLHCFGRIYELSDSYFPYETSV